MAMPAYITPEAYLELEKTSPEKHEYQGGEMFAMAGASDRHVRLTMNMTIALAGKLRGRPCRAFASDMKVQVESVNAYYYPDLLVTCDPRDKANTHIKAHPSLIVEVLSPSTEAFDRGAKFFNYQTIEAFQAYVLVSQEGIRVEHFFKQGPKRWMYELLGEGDVLHLESLDMDIPIGDLYEDVEFPSEDDGESAVETAETS